MDIIQKLFESSGFGGDVSLVWQNFVMFIIGGVLITLAVKKNFEPLLLIPIGFGAILANLPGAEMSAKYQENSRRRREMFFEGTNYFFRAEGAKFVLG